MRKRLKGENQFDFGYVKFKMPITHPSGDFKWKSSLEFSEVEAGNTV